MPTRLIDGDALWRSRKLKNVPGDIRAEYANLVPLAEANGSFDADPERIWADVYSFNRQDVTVADVVRFLDAFEKAGMLKRWKENDATWGYWNGISKPGRLPGSQHLKRYKNLPPDPPVDDGVAVQNPLPGIVPDCPGEGRNTPEGFGVGVGVGLGLDKAITSVPDAPDPLTPALAEVWNHYLTTTNRNPKLNTFTSTRKKKGIVRLQECLDKAGGNLPNAVNLMKLAIDKLAASDFHMGRDPKTNGVKYNSWEDNVFRSAEQMEGWWQR